MAEPGEKRGLAGGIALLVVGLVILVPSGLCTGVFAGGALIDFMMHPAYVVDAGGMILMATVLGGPFVALGAFLVYRGIKRLRAG